MHNRVRMNIQYASLGRGKYFEVGRTIEIFVHDNFSTTPTFFNQNHASFALVMLMGMGL